MTLPCRDLGLLPSPLVVRLLQPRSARDWPVQDSLSYSLCSRGSPRTVTARIQGDSTRAFPMRTAGSLQGEARLQASGAAGRLLASRGSLTISLTAEANALRQRATQVVSFVATPLP
jgi:hypothetical protein